MAENSKIEWTDHTFNPWWGCVKVSPGCKNCYAETLSNRFGDWWGPEGERRFFGDKHWDEPLKWNRKAEKEEVRYKIFCGSMCDVFENREDLHIHRNRLYELIQNTPNLDWLLLTKRPERVNIEWPWKNSNYILENIWIGTSIENQEQANKRIPELLKIPAKVRFLSCEPLLEEIDLRDYLWDKVGLGWADEPTTRIDWVIVGGESGSNARPMHLLWARELLNQCKDANVSYFFKQWGEYKPCYFANDEFPYHLVTYKGMSIKMNRRPRQMELYGRAMTMKKVGKKKAGRLLDGKEYNEFPNND